MWARGFWGDFWSGKFWPKAGSGTGPTPVTSTDFYRPAEVDSEHEYYASVEESPEYLAMVESAPSYASAVESEPSYRSSTESASTYPGNHDEQVQ